MVNPNEVGIPLPSSLEFSPGPASAERITEILMLLISTASKLI